MDVGQSKGLYGHYGDVFQASTYLTIPGTEETKNCLVEFQLKNGAHILMFSPLVAALSGGHTDLEKKPIGAALRAAYGGIAAANGNDGYVKGWLGIKHEARGDFSFSVGNNISTKLLFLLFVERIIIHPYSPPAKKPW